MKKNIELSAEEIISIIKEKSISKQGINISSNASFLSIISLLDDEVNDWLLNVRPKST